MWFDFKQLTNYEISRLNVRLSCLDYHACTVCLLRFGVMHAVFTNLLLWCSGVMSEAEHFMNNHMRRLSDLGYENLTRGKGQGVDCWLVPRR